MPVRLVLRIASIALAGAAYVLGCHWLMTRAQESPWNVVLVLMPMLVAMALGAWRAGHVALAAIAALAIAALCAQAVLGLRVSAPALYVAQHVGINGFLGVAFGATLRAGHDPLITSLARRVHTHLTPAMNAYTRRVTLAWTLFFVGMVAVSLALYGLAPFDRWAVFANLGTPVAVAAMFAAEYGLRYRLHPEFERTTIAAAVRSYWHSHHAPAAAAGRDATA
jgi:uncharacterized membrane protein